MTDYYKKYKELYRTLVAITILLTIAFILSVINLVKTIKNFEEYKEKIYEQAIEIEDLKEHIYILERGEQQ